MSYYKQWIKCVLAGEGGTGKRPRPASSRGSRSASKCTRWYSTRTEVFNVWDTARQEKFGGLRDNHWHPGTDRKVNAKAILFHRKTNLQYYDFSAKSNYSFEPARKLVGDPNLEFVAMTAILPRAFIRHRITSFGKEFAVGSEFNKDQHERLKNTVTWVVDQILDKVEEVVQFEAVPLTPVAEEPTARKAKPEPIPVVDFKSDDSGADIK
ncbi:hypothetical protein quinque_007846 [Culex quinquefasciatus]